ncbi:hypothetical protein ScPMuIL_006260, partial [Solemya velum]
KRAKDRITALLACSATGEKLKPVIIGKSANPRCFRGCNISGLGVTYFSNKKAWMTGSLFSTWLSSINNKMRREKRKIIMLVDNCSAHPEIPFSHVKL